MWIQIELSGGGFLKKYPVTVVEKGQPVFFALGMAAVAPVDGVVVAGAIQVEGRVGFEEGEVGAVRVGPIIMAGVGVE